MRVKVHVQGIKGSGMIEKGDEASVMFNGILEVDGHLIDEVTEVEASFKGGEFATIKPHLIPGTFEVITHDKESWPELLRNLEEQRDLYSGSGRLIVAKEEADPDPPVRLLHDDS